MLLICDGAETKVFMCLCAGEDRRRLLKNDHDSVKLR